MPPKLSPDLTRKFSTEEINYLPVRKWDRPVRLIRQTSHLDAAVACLSCEAVLGFDTETRPSFKRGEHYAPSLIQLAGAMGVYVFQLKLIETFEPLARLLSDGSILKVGVGLENDLRGLQEVFSFHPSGFMDLGTVARRAGIKSQGLRSMAACFFGFRISKKAQCSNWAAPDLRSYQVEYAATDAWISREIYLFMKESGMMDHHPHLPGTSQARL